MICFKFYPSLPVPLSDWPSQDYMKQRGKFFQEKEKRGERGGAAGLGDIPTAHLLQYLFLPFFNTTQARLAKGEDEGEEKGESVGKKE